MIHKLVELVNLTLKVLNTFNLCRHRLQESTLLCSKLASESVKLLLETQLNYMFTVKTLSCELHWTALGPASVNSSASLLLFCSLGVGNSLLNSFSDVLQLILQWQCNRAVRAILLDNNGLAIFV